MFTLSAAVRIYVAAAPCDLRCGFDGVSALTRRVIGTDPLSGHLFVFLNRRRDRIKLLAWDRTGYVVVYKRLERGTFRIPLAPQAGAQHVEVDAGELTLMLGGLDLRQARRQSRWYRSPRTAASCGRARRVIVPHGHRERPTAQPRAAQRECATRMRNMQRDRCNAIDVRRSM